jgi:hypothetical protein
VMSPRTTRPMPPMSFMGRLPNDEVERRGASLSPNGAALSQSSTSLLGSPKTRPAIARTDC